MLKRQLPHALITTANPVFDYELRSIRRPRSVEDLQKYTLNMLIVLHLGLGSLWLLSLVLNSLSNAQVAPLIPYLVAAISGVVIMIASDVYYVLVTVGTTCHQIESGQWDLLRLTEVRGEHILVAKYALAQIRVWRFMTLEIGVRIAGVVFTALFNLPVFLMLLVTLPVSWCLVVLIIGYVAEPLWRMKALVALGVAIATRVQNHTFAVIAALLAVLGIQIARIAVLGVMGFVAFGLLPSRYNIFCILPLAAGATTYVLYVFYRRLQRDSLRRAIRFTTQPS
jgi:hypothetical protein